MRHLVSIHDWSAKEVSGILTVAAMVKGNAKDYAEALKGRVLGMIFQKSSTRTRVSFEVGMYQLGGRAIFLSADDIQLGRGETIADTAKVLSRFVDVIMIRTYDHRDVEELAEHADVPVINGLDDLVHPCQVLSDLFTIQEKIGGPAGKRIAYVGDGNNVAHSLMYAAAKVGCHINVATPSGYEPNAAVVEAARGDAAKSGAIIGVMSDPREAVKDADVVCTDVWASMGQEAEHRERVAAFAGYQVDAALMEAAGPDALFMHCLPAHRGEEVTGEVIDGPRSIVWDQAENRMHLQKALLVLLLKDEEKRSWLRPRVL
ncbi:ornithine carbamoyltransferase [Thermodesulfobacteriota bacterium]